MAMSNTSDRYEYIFGSTVRNLDSYEPVERITEVMNSKARQKTGYDSGKKMPAQISHEELAVKRNQRRFYALDRKFAVLLLLSVILVAISCAVYVNKSSQISSMARQVKQLKTEKANLLNKQAAIKSEIDKALDLEEIRSYAESNLKMVDPTGSKVIYYQNDSDDYFRQYGNVESGE